MLIIELNFEQIANFAQKLNLIITHVFLMSVPNYKLGHILLKHRVFSYQGRGSMRLCNVIVGVDKMPHNRESSSSIKWDR